ncbi:hypothetical protein RI065_09420 [Mycoplasmatota bacterium zrk1]
MKLNNNGYSVITILAATMVLSIASISIITHVNNMYGHSNTMQKRAAAFNIAEEIYNHTYASNRSTFTDDDDAEDWIGYYNQSNCQIASSTGSLQKIFDVDTCNGLLNQTINGDTFNSDDIFFYVYKMNESTMNRIVNDSSLNAPKSFKEYASEIILNSNYDTVNVYRISICVTYSENENLTLLYNGFLLR